MAATWSGLGWPRDRAEARVASRPDRDSQGLGWSDACAVLVRSGPVTGGSERGVADAADEAGGIDGRVGAGRFAAAGQGSCDEIKIAARKPWVPSGARDGDSDAVNAAGVLPAATLSPVPVPVPVPERHGTAPGVGWPGPDDRAGAVMLSRASGQSGPRMPVREDVRSPSVLARGAVVPAAVHYEGGIGWPAPAAEAGPGTERSAAESPGQGGGPAGDLVPGTAKPVDMRDDWPAGAVSRETDAGAGSASRGAGLRDRPERSEASARAPEEMADGDGKRGHDAWRGDRSVPDPAQVAADTGDGGPPLESSTGWPGSDPGGPGGAGAGEPESSESSEPGSAAGGSGLGWFATGQASAGATQDPGWAGAPGAAASARARWVGPGLSAPEVAGQDWGRFAASGPGDATAGSATWSADNRTEPDTEATRPDAGAAGPGSVGRGGSVPGDAALSGPGQPDTGREDQASAGSGWRLLVSGTGVSGTGVSGTGPAGESMVGEWGADLSGDTGGTGATGGSGRHAAAERTSGGDRIAPRHGRPLGWYAAGNEGAGPDRANQADVPPGAGPDLPGDRVRTTEVGSWGTSQPPGGPMIADGISYGARSALASESEDEVAIPAAPDASADTPIARAAQAAMKARAASRPWPKPRSCRIMTIANQKGGVGKTTTAVNMAASLAMHGARVLVVDLDPQGNASTALDVEHRAGTSSIYHVLVEGRPLQDVVQQVAGFPYLYCAPATIDLAGAEIELVPLVAREARLGRAIAEFDTAELDYVLIDCPPSLGLLTVNALVAAPEVLIPIQCEYYALEGLEQLLRTIELVKSHLNPGLSVSTILLTMFDSRTRLASQVAEEVRSHFGDLVLSSVIPRSVRVSEAPSYGQSVMTYDPGSNGAVAYLEAAREMAYRSDGAG